MTRRNWNINLEEMMEVRVHFGHKTKKWNPSMAPYIFVKCKGMHITNLTRTSHFLSEASDLVFDAASMGQQFLIVGTKKIAVNSVASATILKRKLYHLETYLGGIKYLTWLPNIVIAVDQQDSYKALRECVTLGIPTICLIDTNCDPDLADLPFIGSIRFIHNKLVSTICEGRSSSITNR